MLQWKWGLRFSLQNGRPHDSSSGSGPNWGWAAKVRNWGVSKGLIEGDVGFEEAPPASWLAWRSLARGLSVSPALVKETMKLTPNFDLSEMVGLTSSPKNILYRSICDKVNGYVIETAHRKSQYFKWSKNCYLRSRALSGGSLLVSLRVLAAYW